jgi:hypothetical protein
MPKFRKKPVVIDAIHWDGEDWELLRDFLGDEMWSHVGASSRTGDGPAAVHITTLEGIMTAGVGDWIIWGVKGEFYPCRADIFEATYEPVVS